MPSNRPNTGHLRLRALLLALALLLAPLSLAATPALAAPSCTTSGTVVTCTFNYTGAPETWIVPAGVTTVTVEIYAGSGGTSIYGAAPGGNGGHLKATLPVNPGDTLDLTVAAAGGGAFAPAAFGGGGASEYGGGGGGASSIKVNTTLMLVAGGGGGNGTDEFGSCGEAMAGGGGAAGQPGENGQAIPGCGGVTIGGGQGGAAGTQSGPGSGGAGGVPMLNGNPCWGGDSGNAGGSGSQTAGGSGPSLNGGAGGGGYWGGGGGGAGASGSTDMEDTNCQFDIVTGGGGGGGGGSSYFAAGATQLLNTADHVGNGLVTIAYIVSDTSAPVITPSISGTAGSNGWYTSNVSVSWSIVDNESTITNQTGCSSSTVNSDTSGVTFTCTATSAGGTSSQSVTIKRDTTAPTITFANRTAPNPAGWNNGAVTVNWTCSDTTSGATSAGVSQSVSSEGANQSAAGICTDNAGHSSSNTQTGINIDLTAPTLAPAVSPNPIILGGSATVSSGAADVLSGLASQSCGTLDTSSVGTKSVSCTASDKAGNSASKTASYQVIYSWNGFSSPVDNLPTINSANAGRNIPLKWRLTDASGNPITNLSNVTVTSVAGSCGTGGSADGVEEYASSPSGLQNLGNGYYQFNWKTEKSWSGCRTLKLDLGGQVITALFEFR